MFKRVLCSSFTGQLVSLVCGLCLVICELACMHRTRHLPVGCSRSKLPAGQAGDIGRASTGCAHYVIALQGALRTRLAAFLGFLGPTAPEAHGQQHSGVQPADAAAADSQAAQPGDPAMPTDAGPPAADGGSSPGERKRCVAPRPHDQHSWLLYKLCCSNTIMTCKVLVLGGRDAPALTSLRCSKSSASSDRCDDTPPQLLAF